MTTEQESMRLDGRRFDNCWEKEPASCTGACPFGLDLRVFTERIQRGAFNAAFKTYRDAVAFPRIVAALCPAPCQAACILAEAGGGIEIHGLERAVVQYAANTKPNDYNLPPKNKRIAVIGAGLSGLACALRLAAKQYPVTLLEKTEHPGGSARQALAERAGGEDIWEKDMREQFQFVEYDLQCGQEITDLAPLRAEYDAIYVATGAADRDFGLQLSGTGAYASQLPGVFLGGELIGHEQMAALADGLQVVQAIERYLKTGAMTEPTPQQGSKLPRDTAGLSATVPTPAGPNGYSQEEAIQEAERCLRCACDACLKQCDLMAYYKKRPPRIGDEVAATIYPGTQDGQGTYAKRLIGTCNQCGLCAEACPQGFDLGGFLLKSRTAMHRKGLLPWAFHDYWLRDLAHALSEEAYLLQPPPMGGQAKRLFFPGCQLGASDPRYVRLSYQALVVGEPATGLWLACCGAPAVWSGQEETAAAVFARLRAEWQTMGRPQVVCACTTCLQMLARYLPEVETVSLWQELAAQNIQPTANQAAEYAIFDPCTSREVPQVQADVRRLAQSAGLTLSPLLEQGRAEARCCSWGGHSLLANPPYTEQVVEKRLAASDLPYLTYCVNCRDTFVAAGKQAPHLLDVLFGLDDGRREPPGCSARRRNREALKRWLLEEVWRQTSPPKPEPPLHLEIAETLRRKLAAEYILEEEAAAVIQACETSGRTVTDQKTGHRLGYAEIGQTTIWVEYSGQAGYYTLHNAYGHRMKIRLESTWKGRKVE